MAHQRVARENPVPRDAVMSLVIPWSELGLTEDFIGATIEALRWGCVMKVDLVYRSGGSRPHNTAYVHFSGWNATGPAMKARDALEDGEELEVQYGWNHSRNRPFWWKVRQSRFVYRPPAPEPPVFRGPTWSVSPLSKETRLAQLEAPGALMAADDILEAELSVMEVELRQLNDMPSSDDPDVRAADEAFQSDLAYHQWLNDPAASPSMPALEDELESV